MDCAGHMVVVVVADALFLRVFPTLFLPGETHIRQGTMA